VFFPYPYFPLCCFAPLPIKIAPKGAIPPTLRNTALDHNFSTRNLRKSSKVSKDSDCSLVSKKNFRKILPSSGLGPGAGEVGQGGLKVLHLWCHSQKNCIPQPQKFFCVQTTRMAESFELLTRSVAVTWPEKFLCKATCDPAVFSQTAWINPGAKVLTSIKLAKECSHWNNCRKQELLLGTISKSGII